MVIVCLLNDKKCAQKVWSKTWFTKNFSVTNDIFPVKLKSNIYKNLLELVDKFVKKLIDLIKTLIEIQLEPIAHACQI